MMNRTILLLVVVVSVGECFLSGLMQSAKCKACTYAQGRMNGTTDTVTDFLYKSSCAGMNILMAPICKNMVKGLAQQLTGRFGGGNGGSNVPFCRGILAQCNPTDIPKISSSSSSPWQTPGQDAKRFLESFPFYSLLSPRQQDMQLIVEARASSLSCCCVGAKSKAVAVASPLMVFHPCRAVQQFNAISPVDCVKLSNDEHILAYSSTTAIKLLELVTGREKRTFVGHTGIVNDLHPGRKSIYTWASASQDGTCCLWDLRQHPAVVLTWRLGRPSTCVRFSPDDGLLAASAVDAIQLFDIRARAVQARYNTIGAEVCDISFHPNEYLLAAGSSDRIVRFWDLESNECIGQSEAHPGPIRRLLFKLDGSSLVTVTDTQLRTLTWEPVLTTSTQDLIPSLGALDMALGSEEILLGIRTGVDAAALYSVPYEEVDVVSERCSLESPSLITDTRSGEGEMPMTRQTMIKGKSSSSGNRAQLTNNKVSQPQLPPGDESFKVSVVDCSTKEQSSKSSSAIPQPSTTGKKTNETRGGHKAVTMTNRKPPPSLKLKTQSSSSLNETANDQVTFSNFGRPRRKAVDQPTASVASLPVAAIEIPNIAAEIGKLSKEATEEEVLRVLIGGQLRSSLAQRARAVELLKMTWRGRGLEAAVTQATECGDVAMVVAMLQVLNDCRSTWTLAVCAVVLPHIAALLRHKEEVYLDVALASLRIILSGFIELIRSGSNESTACSIGVDVSAEERRIRCSRCLAHLARLRADPPTLRSRHAREFSALMQLADPPTLRSRHAREFSALMQLYDNSP